MYCACNCRHRTLPCILTSYSAKLMQLVIMTITFALEVVRCMQLVWWQSILASVHTEVTSVLRDQSS